RRPCDCRRPRSVCPHRLEGPEQCREGPRHLLRQVDEPRSQLGHRRDGEPRHGKCRAGRADPRGQRDRSDLRRVDGQVLHGTAASFDGSGSADNLGIASASWDFGDGSTAMGLMDSHSYANPGLYTATLTVWDYSGNAATATRSVTVRDMDAPIPRGGGDRTA